MVRAMVGDGRASGRKAQEIGRTRALGLATFKEELVLVSFS